MLKETWSKQLGNDGETSDYFVTIVMNCAENLQELESCVGHIRLGLLDVDGRALNARQKAKMVWKGQCSSSHTFLHISLNVSYSLRCPKRVRDF